MCHDKYKLKEINVTRKVIILGYIENGTGKHQSNTVYSCEGFSPAITTIHGGTQQIKILTIS